MYCFCRFLYMYICWDYNYPSVYFGSCLCLFVYFLSSHSFLYLFMCPKIFLFSLFYKHSSIFLQLSLHHPKKMEVFFFFFFVIWLFVVKAPSLVPLPLANQERIWSNLLIFLDFIRSVVSFCLVCSSAYAVNNMTREPRRIPVTDTVYCMTNTKRRDVK